MHILLLLQVFHKETMHYLIDGEDPTHSNWMRYVKCARHVEEQNMAAYQCSGNIYYQALRNIPPESELLIWYGEEYAAKVGVTTLSEGNLESTFHCMVGTDHWFVLDSFITMNQPIFLSLPQPPHLVPLPEVYRTD